MSLRSDDAMRACILIRHGETAMAGLFCGLSDPPLNAAGREQIRLATGMIGERPQIVYASDLKRARESAELVAAYFAVPLRLRTGLREIGFGEWEGLSWEQVEETFPAEARAWADQYPYGVIRGGEVYDAFRMRVLKEMAFLLAEAKGHSLLAVTHGGFIRTVLTDLYAFTQVQAERSAARYASIVRIPPHEGFAT